MVYRGSTPRLGASLPQSEVGLREREKSMTMISEGVRTGDSLVDEDPALDDLRAMVHVQRELINAMQRDWFRMNALLNATATSWGWCSTYENRLNQYNDEFEVMHLQGRSDRTRGQGPDCFPITIERLLPEGDSDYVATYRVRHRNPDRTAQQPF